MTQAEIIAAAREIVSRPTMYYPDGVQMNIARELLRLHDGGKWSNTPPTEPGWYWWKSKGGSETLLDIIRMSNDELFIRSDPYSLQKYCSLYGGSWLGPISPADAATLAELRAENERLRETIREWDEKSKHICDMNADLQAELAAARAERDAAKVEIERLRSRKAPMKNWIDECN